MQSNTRIILNMQAPNVAVVVNAKQGDKLSRVIIADLVDGDIPFIPPSGVAAVVRYFKPDKTIGFYDVTEDGAAAVTMDGSEATITLAEQTLTVPGNVCAEINFYTSTEKLTTFNFIIHVQKSAVSDQVIESTDYFSVLTQKINALLGASTNPPYINAQSKNWMIWSENAGEYVDSGFSSIGLIPPSTVTYQAGTSGTTPPTGTWLSSIPEVTPGGYLWTRTQFEFSNGTLQTSYSVARQGVNGSGAVNSVNNNFPNENGNVYVMTVNPNLLDNWYFSNPVNQRGKTEYTAVGYSIDRWYLNRGSLEIVDDGVQLKWNGTSGTDAYIQHRFPIDDKYFYGKPLTFSALVDGELYSITATPTQTAGFSAIENFPNGYISITTWNSSNVSIAVTIATNTTGGFKLIAAKLELGDTQTLAHQDSSGNWVLNEIPNYGEQLARCQRYFVKIPKFTTIGMLTSGGVVYYMSIYLPVPMRTAPVVGGSPQWRGTLSSGGRSAHASAYTAFTNAGVLWNDKNSNTLLITDTITEMKDENNTILFFEIINLELSSDL